jgi:hypothetical protein
MEELTIQTNVIYLEDEKDEENDDEEAQPWTQLKRLELKWCLDWSEDKVFCGRDVAMWSTWWLTTWMMFAKVLRKAFSLTCPISTRFT